MEKLYKIISIITAVFALITQAYAQPECITAAWELTPAPANGAYAPGQVVQMCVTITDYNPTEGNSIHGIIPILPDGWDLFSITPVDAPVSCSGTGTWQWYQSIISGSDNMVYGPGYFFNTGTDNNPGNNFGDLCAGAAWQFCISVTLRADCGGAGNQLNNDVITPGFRITTDGQSGNWNAASQCEDAMTYPEEEIIFSCCSANSGNSAGPVIVCGTDPINLNDNLIDNPDAGGVWTNGLTGVALPGGIFTPFVNPGGTYRYTITDESCVSYTNVEVNTSYNPNAGSNSTADICITDPPFNLSTLLNGMPNPGGVWTNENGDVISGTPFNPQANESGVYTYTVYGGPLCPLDTSATLSLTINTCPGIAEALYRELQLFPNPAAEWLTLELERPVKNLNIYIYDLVGREVFSEKKDVEKQLKLNVKYLQPGVYIIYLDAGGFNITRKFTKK